MNIIFMGTPLFGRRILEELVKEHNVTLVVTQPDTVKGKKTIMSPVKELAVELGLNVFQPVKIKDEMDVILNTPCDLIVTAAFGQFIPSKILNYPPLRCINVHGSLLPKYRGGAPIQRAIMNGEAETGITIMYMEKGMDSGDILEQASMNIEGKTADEVFEGLANLGASRINSFIEKLKNNQITPIKQVESDVSFAYNITKEEEQLDFNQNYLDVYHKVLGLSSNPGAFFTLNGAIFKVYNATPVENIGETSKILEVTKDYFVIGCMGGAIKFSALKPEGKNLMPFKDYYNGKGKDIFKVNVEVNK